MSIAFSKLPIVRATASGSTRGELIASLAAILVSAGWSATALADGYRLTCTSPQGFQAALWLQDLGQYMVSVYGPAISLRMSCADQSNTSPYHKLVASADRDYDVIAGACQVFIALPETTSEAATVDGFWGHHFAAGVPWLPDDETGPCLGALDIGVTAAWWLSGDGLHSFRNGWHHEGSNWAGYWSTDGLKTRYGGNTWGHLQARPISLPNAPYAAAPALPPVRYADDTPMLLDPLVAWGKPGRAEEPLIRGQIWDAVWSTEPLELGDLIETTEADEETAAEFTARFECWSQTNQDPAYGISSTWLGCLCLVPGGDAETGWELANYAY